MMLLLCSKASKGASASSQIEENSNAGGQLRRPGSVHFFPKKMDGRRLLHQRQLLCPFFQGAGLLKLYWQQWLII